MRKIPTLFKRNPNDMRLVLPEVTLGCEWVLVGEGIPTRKYDGTCVMLDEEGRWWARREVKLGKHWPENFQPIETDPTTGKTVGWEPIEQSPFSEFHAEALCSFTPTYGPGTFELIGPKINGNPEHVQDHTILRHGHELLEVPLGYYALLEWLLKHEYEGIVWHHPDGRMAKLKRRDFGFSRYGYE